MPSSPSAALWAGRPTPLLLAAWAGLALACGVALFDVPHPWLWGDQPLAVAAASATVAWIDRRRWADALLMALPPLAGKWVDPELGAQALGAACLSLYLLTRRPRFAAVAGSAAVGLLLAAISLKQRFAGTLLTWQDMTYFFRQLGDNVGVLGTQPTLLAWAAGALAVAGGSAVAAWAWNPPGRPVGRAAPWAAAVLAAGLLAHQAGLLAQGVSSLATSGAWFVATGLQDRPLIGFFATRALQPQWQLPPVDTQAFQQASQRWVTPPGTAGGAPPADIVVILQESQFNPATLQGCSPATCQVDAFAPGAQTVAHGPLQVHTFGGGTWLSEFTLQTGVPHDTFGPAGEFAPFSIAPHVRRSLARSLKAAGYRTVAVYPTRGGMMNGRAAYAGYGFDEFLDASQVGLPETWGTPDALVHQAARRVLAEQRRHGQPVFLFVETLFNHAEHGVEMDRVPAALRASAARDFASEDEWRSVADYVWRSREFAREMAATRQAVLGTARPAVLAWFGDHQPPFANAVSLRQRVQPLPTANGTVPAKYQTWYEVASNRAAPHRVARPTALDLALLPGLLAQAAGAPLDDWLAANVQARVACGGLLESCREPDGERAYLDHLRRDLRAIELP